MAHPITFKPHPVDYHKELMKRVEAAPQEHAEALLVAWDLLQTSHDQGILELAQGLIGGKDVIAGKLAEAANLPESVTAIRNGIAMARVLGSVDPEMLQRLAKGFEDASKQHGEEKEPPGLWALFRRSTSADARRGLSYLTSLLVVLGRATRPDKRPAKTSKS
jgi:uncharacterized protein YjgD (DUF1641 family)